MHILVTGGAGFIGSHVAETLRDDGHRIWVLDDLSSGVEANIPAGVEFLPMGLGDGNLGAALRAIRPRAVFHLAAQIDVRVSCQDPVRDARENILNTLALLEAGLDAGMDYFAFASSGGAIYGEASGPQDEDHPEVPINPYGVAKLAVDKYLQAYRVQRGLKSCSLRFSNVYGPRQGAKGEAGVVAVFARRLLQGLPPVINGDGLQTRDFVYVADLARATRLALAREAEGVFNLGTGRETSVLDLARILCAAAGQDPSRIEHREPVPGEQRRSLLASSRAEPELGWRAGTTVEDGLAATWRWFRNQDGPLPGPPSRC